MRKQLSLGPVLFTSIYIVVQVAVPMIQLSDVPSPFGWHMFAGIRTLEAFAVVRADGSEHRVDPGQFYGNMRADVTIQPTVLASRICEQWPDAIEVRTFHVVAQQQTRTFPCER